eukprot:gene4624-257_t
MEEKNVEDDDYGDDYEDDFEGGDIDEESTNEIESGGAPLHFHQNHLVSELVDRGQSLDDEEFCDSIDLSAKNNGKVQLNEDEPMWFSDLKTPRSEVEKSLICDETIKFGKTHDDDILNDFKHNTTVLKKSSSRRLSTECTGVTSAKAQGAVVEDQSDKLITEMNCQTNGCSNPSATPLPPSVVYQSRAAIGPKKGGRRRLNKEEERAEDSSLRYSLDALSKSDRKTRGRIESELLTFFSKDEKSHHMNDARAGVNSELSLHNMDYLSDGVLNSEIEKQNLLKLRSNRIDEVQETVSSALQDLASVMSNLTKSGVVMTQVSPDVPPTEITSECSPVMKVNSSSSNNKQSNVNVLSALNDEMENVLCSEGSKKLPLSDLESSTHEIPVLPSGQVLQLDILSTW